ncbi:MAG: hypothetical protein HY072_01760, partial [Deltaproteobacteria bacterium]|nr:hypothetical protein [Deltaproteobacteria bacterium]
MRQYFFGRWIENSEPLSVEQAQELCTQAEKIRSDFSQYPLDKVLEILDKMKRLWENPEYPNRKIVLNTLPSQTGFSKEMIELGLNELSFIFDTNYLNKKLKT